MAISENKKHRTCIYPLFWMLTIYCFPPCPTVVWQTTKAICGFWSNSTEIGWYFYRFPFHLHQNKYSCMAILAKAATSFPYKIKCKIESDWLYPEVICQSVDSNCICTNFARAAYSRRAEAIFDYFCFPLDAPIKRDWIASTI